MSEKNKENAPQVDFVIPGNEQGQMLFDGEVAGYMAGEGWKMDAGMLRPFVAPEDGRAYITVYVGGPKDKPESYATYGAPQTLGTLRRDEWKLLDQAVLQLSEYRLGGVQDLIDANLTYDIGSGLGTTVLEYHDISDALTAEVTMDGITRAKNDRPKFGTNYLPLPIIHADYQLNARVLAASRRMGNPLDTTLAERAGRKVLEQLENMLFTATTYAFGGGTIYSYLNHPDRNTVSLTTAWTSATGAQIVTMVLAMKQASLDAYHYGPWQLYIPSAYETVLDKDYDATTPGTTIRERIMKISGIKGIKVVDTLTAGNVLLVQMSPDVVRLVRGMGVQNVEWSTEGKLITNYKVMTIQVPQIRSDQEGHSGIVHMS